MKKLNKMRSKKNNTLSVMDIVHIIAGIFIVFSVLLGMYVSHYWLYFTLFVGLNLFQFGFTKFCPLEKIIKKVMK